MFGLVREFETPPVGNNRTGNPFKVDAYVIVEEALVTLFPCPLLSSIVVTRELVNVTVDVSAGSIHNWHPSMSVGTKFRENGLMVEKYGWAEGSVIPHL
jgi:hypothetical protein